VCAAFTAGIINPLALAQVLAAAVAAGDPLRDLVPLFPLPVRVPVRATDDFPVDLFDSRAAPLRTRTMESVSLFEV